MNLIRSISFSVLLAALAAAPASAQVEASEAQATAGTAGWPYVMTPRRTAAVASGSDDQTAAEVAFTPAGGIAADDAQEAIEELDTEKRDHINAEVAITVTPGTPDTATLTWTDGKKRTLTLAGDTDLSYTTPDEGDEVEMRVIGHTVPVTLNLVTTTISEGLGGNRPSWTIPANANFTVSIYYDGTNYLSRGDPITLYRTIYIDAAAMVPRTTNGAAANTSETSTNDIMVDALLFDGATSEGAQFKLAMPDEWDRGTIKVKLYWDAASGASAADTVEWEVSAGALSNDDAIDAALGSAVTVGDVVIAVGDVHVTAASAALTVGGTPALGDLVWFQVIRDPSGTDDMTEDAKLLGIAVQYAELPAAPSLW